MLGAVTTHPKPQVLAYSESKAGRTALLGTPIQSSESRVWAPSIIRIPHFLGYLILSPKERLCRRFYDQA